MKRASSARRVPRKIGSDQDEPLEAENSIGSGVAGMLKHYSPNDMILHSDCASSRRASLIVEHVGASVKRPITKQRNQSSLRTSFGPTATNTDDHNDDDDDVSSGVVKPKKGALSRVAIHRSASKRSSLLAQSLSKRASPSDDDDDRPNYSADSLRQLKDSTPSTPRELSTPAPSQALDLSSKFGSSLARYEASAFSSAIPSAAEIAEKKSRRARLAKEQAAEEYISLDPDDPNLDEDGDGDDNVMTDELGRLVLKPKDKYNQAESRLVRDDEDIMENFDDFTEDGKVALGRKAEVEAQRKRKADMAAQIAEAEADEESDDSNTSERERNAVFEAAQTRHGTYNATGNATSDDPYEYLRPKTPPKISPLPTLDRVVERLRRQLAEMQSERSVKLQEMAALQREKIRLGEEEVRIQKALKETAEKFRLLREEKGISVSKDSNETDSGLLEAPPASNDLASSRNPAAERIEDAEDELDAGTSANGLGVGLGFGMGLASTGSTGMSRMYADDPDDY